MNPNLSFISSNIRRYRKSRKWTQEEMARRANISRIALIHIESGKALPTLETLASLAAVLEIPMAGLLARPPEKEDYSVAERLANNGGDSTSAEVEIDHIVEALRTCSAGQINAIRRIIESVIFGFTEKSASMRMAD